MRDVRGGLAAVGDGRECHGVILVDGELWGTAREIADQLGRTEKTVRRWYERRMITGIRMADEGGRPQVRHRLSEAARVRTRGGCGPDRA
jgi:hypothetical protein